MAIQVAFLLMLEMTEYLSIHYHPRSCLIEKSQCSNREQRSKHFLKSFGQSPDVMKFYTTIIFFLFGTTIFAQSNDSSVPPINWQLMDWQKDGFPGISLEKAYNELLKNKKPLKKIVVAIIDDGLDDKHPDLAGMEWMNAKE